MSIEAFRDLMIGVAGAVAILVLIFFSVLAFALYRRTKSLLDSLNATARTVKEICTVLGEGVVKPLAQAVTFIQGIRLGMDTLLKFFRRKETRKDGKQR